jgi:phthiodiolone/phenolphthiodiolone dimycocerosates ketoreductase
VGSPSLTIGAPASILPDVDPIDDVVWADSEPAIGGVWFIDHLLGWVPRGVDPEVVADPHAVMDPFSLMAAGARQTTRVPIGIAVTDPLRLSPAALAQAALTIGWLGGRPMLLGLGTGGRFNLEAFGLDRPRKFGPLSDACADIGAYIGRDSGAREPLGLASVAEAKLYVGAHGPKTIDLTAQYGDGWLPSSLMPKPYASRLHLLRERAEVHGRDPASIRPVLQMWAALGETREESLAMLERPFVRSVALYSAGPAFERYGAVHPTGGEYMPGDMTAAEALAAIDRIPIEVARDVILAGSIDEIAERLSAYEEAGCEHVIIYDIGRYLFKDGVERSRACLTALARR